MSNVITMKALLESGVHFGHRTNKWNPAMKPYIFTERNSIHIIDLQQTVKAINDAYAIIRDKVANGGVVLFVGTKRQAQETIKDEAERCGMPYVTERWLGGTITNWSTIQQRIHELERLERMRDSGEILRLTKKEGLMIERQIRKLETRLSGIRNMKMLPDVLFVVDVGREETSIHEANLKKIPVIAMVDTNCDPRYVDHIIPSNDDAIRAIKLMVAKIADAALEGKAMRTEGELDEVIESSAKFDAKEEAVRIVVPEEEVGDEALLGEATLAKLSKTKEETPVTEEAPAEAEETVEETAAVVTEEAPAEAEETVEDTVAVVTEEAPAEAEETVEDTAADKTEEAPVEEATETEESKE
ncbi:MAG: 30S ribosomal protein S2 [Anaerolineaceae bacterium]|nr:30S ribosomal protein S2 [Anaerolineaceae bacterium]